MRFNKFETYGIGFSIAAMALALYIVELRTTPVQLAGTIEDADNTGAVFVADSENQRAALADAFIESSGGDSTLERLIIDDVVVGDGREVSEGDQVSVHYIGTLQNGQQFDNSYLKGEPFRFTVGSNRVIQGWNEGIVGMHEGGQRIIVVPPELAYGSEGFGPIPKNATLVFAIELLSVNE